MEEFTDACFVCRAPSLPWKVLKGDLIANSARSFYVCKEPHSTGQDADWWTDRIDGQVVERIAIVQPDPTVPGGGTTWSGVPLPAYG